MSSQQRPEKILQAMYELSRGTAKSLQYEDIVVEAFKLFPADFSLRGYPNYPDSSDLHKPLYGPLKRSGYVISANKTFKLTPKGVEHAKKLRLGESPSPDRLDRETQTEVSRLIESDAFRMIVSGRHDSVLDTDFYSYIGVTVRTPKNDFIGRLTAVRDAVIRYVRVIGNDEAEMLQSVQATLERKFQILIGKMGGVK